jgi:hypothetical protein
MKIGDNISRYRLAAISFIGIAMLVISPSCFNDDFNKAMKLELLPLEILIPLDDIPTPGNNGTIIPGIVNNTSIQIQWMLAEDKETTQSELVYRVYISDFDNINTVKLAEENGMPVDGWQKDITSAVVGSLTPNTTYYFNVLVRDSAGNKAAYLSLSVTTSISPINVPLPGNGGIITTTAVGSSSIQLSWTQATDVETSQIDLEYSLYRSDSNNIATPDDADKNGMVVASWQKDMVMALAESLSPSTNYYFNVIVRDGDGNRSAYVTIAVTTASNTIYLYSAGQYTGNLTTPTSASAREDIDGLCKTKTAKTALPPCLYTRAFISVSAGDDIASMPKNYGVPTDKIIISTTNIKIADNWFDLLDGTIDETLSKAGVANNFWWSGSDVNGSYPDFKSAAAVSTNCADWTDGTNASSGNDGATNKTDATWLYEGYSNCNNSLHVLCICW